MFWKSFILLTAYAIPYVLLITGVITNVWLMLAAWMFMGATMSGIGFSIMHDANHGAYSQNKTINKYMGYVINLVGGSSVNWKIQHNVLHHTYTNVEGVDEDIDPGILMRLSPHAKHYKMHRLQHIYGWFLYSLMTFLWITTKDFRQLFRYKKMGLTKAQNVNVGWQLTKLALSKVVYYTIFLAIPLLTIAAPWWIIVIHFIAMHMVAGFILGIVFQPAHVMPTTQYPLPDEEGNLENDWAIHQLYTTTNFSPNNWFLNWYVGGLNFQVEHHLFPTICHVHYKKLSAIVRKTAEEFGLPYHQQPTFWKAISLHASMLKQLGQPEKVRA
ncbi:acyl-CoA desaturase [Fulvivirga lutea]|uniref:Acyl-CoA desaturase n=2 Tax=Fulvivirga lutea TaxID=2810512 RepID=A0A975A2F8_9BACT|nr:acyl-CoA desaturase [Fulvivirga lutea]